MASLNFLRWIGLVMPRPSSKSSSVSPSSTWRAQIQASIKPEDTDLLINKPTLTHMLKKQQKHHLHQRYLATFDVFRAGSDVHRHSHNDLQPGLDCTCPPHWHACASCELRLLEAIKLLLSVRQALLCEAVRIWIVQEKLWCGIQEGFRVRGIRKSEND